MYLDDVRRWQAERDELEKRGFVEGTRAFAIGEPFVFEDLRGKHYRVLLELTWHEQESPKWFIAGTSRSPGLRCYFRGEPPRIVRSLLCLSRGPRSAIVLPEGE